jgi:transposase
VKESGIKKALIIGDKGFYSEGNIESLSDETIGMDYIFPLKRNSSLIDYTPLESGNKRNFDGYFLFEKRVIWHYEKKIKDKRIVVFLDERLKTEEEKDMMIHIEDKKIPLNNFYERQFRIGTIAIITKTDLGAKKIYELLKSRVEIEIAFDTFKNILHADRTYMREDAQLEGWMLINFVSMLMYYKIYSSLLKHDLLKKFSPKDVLLHFSRVQKINIGGKWITSEIPKTTRLLAEKLGLQEHIT